MNLLHIFYFFLLGRACLSESLSLKEVLRNKLSSCDANTTLSDTKLGSICGLKSNTKVNKYIGIPYAMPFQRFEQATLKTRLTLFPNQVFQATSFGSSCVQSKNGTIIGSEDCLFLNVFTPSINLNDTNLLPVMVFIHGGEFLIGSGSQPDYDGTSLAQNGVVIVTIEYRLGLFGFLTNSEIKGNMGLFDQQLALQWVQEFISIFGGDPSKVTIFGESAGAMSIGFHLFSMPGSQNLFRAAIMESNVLGIPYPELNSTDLNSRWSEFQSAVCVTLNQTSSCEVSLFVLQHLTVDQLMAADHEYQKSTFGNVKNYGLAGILPWLPYIDFNKIQSQPLKGYSNGMVQKPFIFGFNRNESVLIAAPIAQGLFNKVPPSLQNLVYTTFLDYIVGKTQVNTVTNTKTFDTNTYYYNGKLAPPVLDSNSPSSALNNVINDMIFRCASLNTVKSLGDNGNQTIYGYVFTQRSQPGLYNFGGQPACLYPSENVCHTAELPFVFNTLNTVYPNGQIPLTDLILADQIGKYWTEFAINLEVDIWPQYIGSGYRDLLILGDGRIPTDIYLESSCQMWKNQVPYSSQ